MTTLSAQQIYTLARSVGLGPAAAVTATGIAFAESGGKTDAVGDQSLENATWGPSVGLWQIRSLKSEYGKGTTRDETRLADPLFNAASMASVSGAGKSFSAWSTYTNGAYKQFTQAGAASAVADGDNPTASTGNPLGEAASSILSTLGLGAGTSAASAAGQAAGAFGSSWGSDVLKIGLYVVGGGAAAALVIVGAVHTVSEKG